jgi:hypothetical protein
MKRIKILNIIVFGFVILNLGYSLVNWWSVVYSIDLGGGILEHNEQYYDTYSKEKQLNARKEINFYKCAIPLWEQQEEQWKIKWYIESILTGLLLINLILSERDERSKHFNS